jgi:hypothetical protein
MSTVYLSMQYIRIYGIVCVPKNVYRVHSKWNSQLVSCGLFSYTVYSMKRSLLYNVKHYL